MPEPKQNSDQNIWINRIGAFVMSIALMMSSWFLNQAWDRINIVEKDITQLKLDQVTSSANRFTITDWSTNKTILDSERSTIDRRVMRLEETFTATKDTLTRIEVAVNKHIEGGK